MKFILIGDKFYNPYGIREISHPYKVHDELYSFTVFFFNKDEYVNINENTEKKINDKLFNILKEIEECTGNHIEQLINNNIAQSTKYTPSKFRP